ncbi:MAG: glutaredoxin domain-containing protein [Cyanobacteria bacterium P01_H01_bin.74]
MTEISADLKEKLTKEINQEIQAHKLFFYGKGTKDMPLCGFTVETVNFLEKFGYPFEVIDVLHNMEKRAVLSEMTDWPTLPKVFINGKFYGDTDTLEPMAQNGELETLLKETFSDGVPTSA